MTSFRPGDVLEYHYLWQREAGVGEESGRKFRPTCVVVTIVGNPTKLFLYPLTTRPPSPDQTALKIPDIERKRAGLDETCWLVLDELNVATSDELYDFETLVPTGSFSPAFTRTIVQEALNRRRRGRVDIVKRI